MAITTGRIADEALPKRIKVTDGNHHVTFELNETSAAQSLYNMLPTTRKVQDYSTNEKIFYPETDISYSSDCIEGACPAGTLALFSPWGNVVMYYGDASQYPGLYILGNAVEGADQISELTGNITVSKVELAKERLNTAVKNQIAAKGTAYSLIAPTAAQAFIIHAEGNETENASAATLSTLVSAAEMGKAFIGEAKAQELKDMATSMLEDKSQYGTDRENVTNDLTLSIELPEAIKLAADGYSTYCSENRLDISKTTGVTAYIVNNVTETTVELQEVSVIPAETGFILKGTGNALYDLYKTESAADDVSGNQLHGTLTELSAPANTFALSTKKGVTGFYPVNTGLMIPAHKAYLTVSGNNNLARALVFDGKTTGIMNADSHVDVIPSEYYSIHGIKVERPTKGIYISNGKKVVIK